MKLHIGTLTVVALVIYGLSGLRVRPPAIRKYTKLLNIRLRLVEPFPKEVGWMTPDEDFEFDLPDKSISKEYFAYVNVENIPYPPHPRNTTDEWHRTGTTPAELIPVMKRFWIMMQIIRDKDGGAQPSYDNWIAYWLKHVSPSWARVFTTFYGGQMIRVEKYRDQYQVESGMHRTWLAKRMAFEKLPVQVTEYFDA